MSYLKREPWRFYRVLLVIIEYLDLKTYIRYIHSQAERVRNEKNDELADAIIDRACMSMIEEARRDWPELSGLAAQKLAHLKYHEELKRKKFRLILNEIHR